MSYSTPTSPHSLPHPLVEESGTYTGPAVVLGCHPDDPKIFRVRLPGDSESRPARAAVPGGNGLPPGTRVLVTTGRGPAIWIIGILDTAPPRVAGRDGTSAQVVETGDRELIQVRDASDALLFEYDPARGTARLRVPAGGLEVSAPEGDVTLAAGGAVRLRGQTIDLAASLSVRVFVHHATSRLLSALRLSRDSIRLTTRSARVEADKAKLDVRRTRITGARLETDVAVIRTTAERIETVADAVTERFGSFCRRVTGLVQTHAGRLRMRIRGAWHTRARRSDLRTEETFKVDGERIHLG